WRRCKGASVRAKCPQHVSGVVRRPRSGHCHHARRRAQRGSICSALRRLRCVREATTAPGTVNAQNGSMKLAHLRKIADPAAGETAEGARMRGTEAQDAPLAAPAAPWRRWRLQAAIGAGALLALLLAWAVHGWLTTGQ